MFIHDARLLLSLQKVSYMPRKSLRTGFIRFTFIKYCLRSSAANGTQRKVKRKYMRMKVFSFFARIYILLECIQKEMWQKLP